MVFSSTFVCTVTGKCQYVRSATSFKQRFRIHKSDIKTKIGRCGSARHFNFVCFHPNNPHGYLKVKLIEQVFCDASKDIVFYESVKNIGNVNYLLILMVLIAFLIYVVKVEKVAEKSNLFITTFYV